MAVVKQTPLLGVDDCKIFPITEDTAGNFTCGEGIDVPGIKQISLTLEIDEQELTGDEKTLAVSSKIKSVTFNSEYAKLSQEVLKVLTGGKVTDGEDVSTFELTEGSVPGYFQFQAQIKGTDDIIGGDCHICIYKAKATAIPINGTEGSYATYTFDGKGVYTECKWNSVDGESKLIAIDFNQTSKDLAAKTYAGV